MSKSEVVRVAIIQDAPVAFDLSATLEKTEQRLHDAADRGASLVVFPEAFLGGYPKGMTFGVRIGSRSSDGRDWFARYAESAVTRDGTALRRVQETVRKCGLHCVIGLVERSGGTLYCSAATIGPSGEILSWRRKLMPTALERVVWGAGDGSTLSVANSEIGRIGTAICWENYMPLLRMTLYSQDVQLYCTPTVDDRAVWTSTIQHIALEGRCFVLNACQYAERSDYPADYPIDESLDNSVALIRGGSCIVGPLGDFLVEPIRDRAATLIADCDLRQILRGKMDLDVTGHYSRPDIFQLRIRTEPLNSVIIDAESTKALRPNEGVQ